LRGTQYGSGPFHGDRPHRSLMGYYISQPVRFRTAEISYVYGLYECPGSLEKSESFFPMLWTWNGYLTRWIDVYGTATHKLPEAWRSF
jgi:hypothetical protein